MRKEVEPPVRTRREMKVLRKKFTTKDLVDAVMKLRIEKGQTRANIRTWLIEEVGLTARRAYEIMKESREKFDQVTIQEFSSEIKEDIERFEQLYQLAFEVGNFKEAKYILTEISKLKGHYIERVDLTVKEYTVKFPGID